MDQIISKIALVLTIIVALFTATSLFISIVRKFFDKHLKEENKTLKAENSTLKEEDETIQTESKFLKGINELTQSVIPSAIEFAESIGALPGEAKLSLALSKIAIWCSENDFDYKTHADFIKDFIEKAVSFTKSVNYKGDK